MDTFASFHRWSPLLVVCLVLSVGAAATAVPRDWTNASGANAVFGWTNGQSGDGDVATVGLWGDPITTDQGFFFRTMEPMFEAAATFPSSASTLSGMSVVANTLGAAPPNPSPLTELHIREWGTFTGDIEDVDASGGTVLLLPLSPPGPPINLGELVMTFDAGAGTWTARMDVVFADIGGGFPAGVNILSVDVTNHLKAIPVDGSASIQKLGADVVTPEPATSALGLVGLLIVMRRRHGSRRN